MYQSYFFPTLIKFLDDVVPHPLPRFYEDQISFYFGLQLLDIWSCTMQIFYDLVDVRIFHLAFSLFLGHLDFGYIQLYFNSPQLTFGKF